MSEAQKTKVCSSCRKEVDAKAKRCPYCRAKLSSWFWRHPILTIMIAMFFLPAAIVGMIQDSAEKNQVAEVTIPYETIWDNSENGYIWKSIVVSEQYLNDESMAALGKQLHAEFGNSTFAKVAVFKTEESAALFVEAQKDPYSKKLDSAYEADFMAIYSLNSSTDYEDFIYHLSGLDGKQNEILF